MQAFASELVFTAVQASSTAHRDVMRAFGSWQAEDKKGEIFSQANLDARTAADKAREAADAADDALVELIRTQLQGRGKPLDDWQVFATPDSHQDRIKR